MFGTEHREIEGVKLGLDAAIFCCWTQQFYACVECPVGEREDTFNGRNGRFRLLTKVKARMNISESENQLVERGILPVTIDSLQLFPFQLTISHLANFVR